MRFKTGRWICFAGWVCAVQWMSAEEQGIAQPAMSEDSVLVKVVDVPLPGAPVRFDYQSLDAQNGRLYIAHMNADQLVVFDTRARKVVANLDGFKGVHGVLAVPARHRVFASVTGEHKVIALDTDTLKSVGQAGPIDYPDGVAYAPREQKVFVSDEHGGVDAVMDAGTNTLVAKVPLGGGAGNTVYDAGSGHILVAVHTLNLLVAIDPATDRIIGRYALPGIKDPHGIALDTVARIAYVAGEGNNRLAVFDLRTMKVLTTVAVGADPDVLAFDLGLKRLYVSAESGNVTVFAASGPALKLLGTLRMSHAHTVAVDQQTHLVYFPLQDIGGHPLLRIMRPAAMH